jgi:hypothetical protein
MKKANLAFFVLGLSLLLGANGNVFGAKSAFPISPDRKLTPGSFCEDHKVRRYPEGIAYCNRSVSGATKKDVIHDYDAILGYEIAKMNRQAFKIDHYIPLCMGGSNDSSNLWPQHESVFKMTDPLEGPLSKDG